MNDNLLYIIIIIDIDAYSRKEFGLGKYLKMYNKGVSRFPIDSINFFQKCVVTKLIIKCHIYVDSTTLY